MSNASELPAELWAKLWGEALQRHPDANVLPGPTSIEVACLAYAAGWEARGAVKDSLTTPEELSVVGAPQAEGSVTWWLPEQAPAEEAPLNLNRREVAAWYHGHGRGWQAARAALPSGEAADG